MRLRVLKSIAAELDYEVYMLDVETTFFNADGEEEVFVKAPGYERSNVSGVLLVVKLKKSFYGLRQSQKNWSSTINPHLGKIEFRYLKLDPCVYVYGNKNGSAILTPYVDDDILLGASK